MIRNKFPEGNKIWWSRKKVKNESLRAKRSNLISSISLISWGASSLRFSQWHDSGLFTRSSKLYQFSFLKWGLINPSRPPFFKGRRAFLNAFHKRFLFFPLWKRGTKGDLTAFQKAIVWGSCKSIFCGSTSSPRTGKLNNFNLSPFTLSLSKGKLRTFARSSCYSKFNSVEFEEPL
jgi:hypothetical protein